MQQDGSFGQNTDTAGTEPVQRLTKSSERLRVIACSGRQGIAAHVVLMSDRARLRVGQQPR